MGPAASGLHLVAALIALGRTLAGLGAAIRIGDGIEAAPAAVSAAVPGLTAAR